MTKKFIFGWLFVPALALMMGACGETDDEEESGGGDISNLTEDTFSEAPSSSTVTAKDFVMSDIDALIEVSLKMEGMRLEYTKMMSDNWQGELLGGAGEHTKGAKFFSYVADLLQNADHYQEALNRLEEDGILTKPTVTRLGLEFFQWCNDIINVEKDTHYRMLTILNTMKATGDEKRLQQLFDALPASCKHGHVDPRNWYVDFAAGDYMEQSSFIHETWIESVADGEALGKYFDTWDELYDKKGHPRWKEHHEAIKPVAINAGSFYVSVIDEVTGGYVSKMVDINDISEETIKLAKKIKEGKATTADLKRFAASLGTKYVSEKTGDLFEGAPSSDELEKLAGEINSYVTNHALEQADEEIAEGLGINLYEIQKTTPQGVIVTVIEDAKTGSTTIGFPGKDGNTRVATTPGDKIITTITNKGERVTQKVGKQKPGKVVVESHPQESKATIKLSPEKVLIGAKGGVEKVEIISNCTFYRYRYTKPLPDWISVSRNKNILTITVKPNDSEQPRSYSFLAQVSIKGKEADASTTVTVSQEGNKQQEERPKIEADKTSLTFEADGGEQKVKVNKKTYLYCGGIVDDCGDWVTIMNGSDDTFTVKASANTTGKERSGTIYAFATNTKEPTAEDIELLAIQVTQKAGSQQITQVEISSIKFESAIKTYCTEYHYTHDGKNDNTKEHVSDSEGGYFDHSFTIESISYNFTGSSLHLEGKYEDRGDLHEISFDVTGITGDYKEARVTNLTCKRILKPKSVFGYDYYNFTASYTNIPISKISKSNASNPLTLRGLTFEGKVADGMGISGHSCEKYFTDGWGGYYHYHFDYLNDGENYATLEINFKSVK